jgi:hypothetical protein
MEFLETPIATAPGKAARQVFSVSKDNQGKGYTMEAL